MANIFDERLVINDNTKNNIIYNEHLVRYEFAKQFVKNKKILDIACGSGYGTKMLANAGAGKVIGIDADENTIKYAQKKYAHQNVEYLAGDAEKIEQGSNLFDVIISFETIEHLQNPNKFLSELARVAKRDGLVIISTPNKDVFKQKNPFHLKEFSKNEFVEIISKYFKFCKILDQNNGIASCIGSHNTQHVTHNMECITRNIGIEPLYFIAICSRSDILDQSQIENIGSVNFKALQNLYNNPILKISDKIYSGLLDLLRN